MERAHACQKGAHQAGKECVPNVYHNSNVEILFVDFGNTRTTIRYKDKAMGRIRETVFVEEKTVTIK